ncbi:MAG: sulfotransferase [Candidatus Dadabacteria bacterium]|nr:MAG: sulfotransferase [Candidatus Dadabacteria bacterium]
MTETVSLDEQSILAEALERAGRSRFADESFRTPLRVLLQSLDEEANLNAAGRASMRARIVDLLVNRLRLEEYLERHPEIREEEIGDPLVIVGLPRTGTTMLHRLLSCDPEANSVAWWENRNPAPFPGTDLSRGPDPRIAAAHEQVRQILEAVPELAAIHPWDPEGPDEEILLLEHSFLSTTPGSMAYVPSYDRWMKAQDHTPAYQYLKLMLQFLQWQKRQAGRARRRWVLKTPHHLGFIEYLFATFPGARIVQTHRDPIQTIASVSSMYYALWKLAADDPDPHLVGRYCKEHYSQMLRHCMEVRDRMDPGRFLDVDYRRFVRDPLAEVRRIYEWLGLPLGEELIAQMQWWIEENRRDKRAPHEYTLEKFGLSEDEIRREFAEYRARYIER